LQAAGNLNWNDADDPDSAKERLLDVDAIQPCRRGLPRNGRDLWTGVPR
jgi:hypothetical protein